MIDIHWRSQGPATLGRWPGSPPTCALGPKAQYRPTGPIGGASPRLPIGDESVRALDVAARRWTDERPRRRHYHWTGHYSMAGRPKRRFVRRAQSESNPRPVPTLLQPFIIYVLPSCLFFNPQSPNLQSKQAVAGGWSPARA